MSETFQTVKTSPFPFTFRFLRGIIPGNATFGGIFYENRSSQTLEA